MDIRKTVLALLGLLLAVSLSGCSNSKQPDTFYIFSEYPDVKAITSNHDGQLQQCLRYAQYEDEQIIGFVNQDLAIDFYKIYSCLRCAEVMHQDAVSEQIQSNMSSLKSMDMSAASFLNLMYYMYICHALDIVPEKDPVIYLNKFYSTEDHLYFPFSEEDDINAKLIATRMCALIFEDNMPHRDVIIQTVEAMISNDSFFSTDEDALYNSGGALITCANVLNADGLDRKELQEWFSYWQEKNEPEKIKSFAEAIHYSSFYEVAKCLDQSYDNQKLHDFYLSISEDLLTSNLDPLMLYSVLVNVGPQDSNDVNTILSAFLEDCTVDALQLSRQLDFSETVAGLILSRMLNRPLDEGKVQNYLLETWANSSKDSDHMRIKKLYDMLFLSTIYDLPDLLKQDTEIQATIDLVLLHLLQQEDLQASLITARRILETVAFLQTKQRNVNLSGQQKQLLKKLINQAAQDKELLTSYSAIDIWIANAMLDMTQISNKEFLLLCESLAENGGYKASLAADYADIWTSMRIIACYRVNETAYDISATASFLDSLDIGAGLYAFNEMEKKSGTYSLQTILYGTMLANINY